MKDHYIHIHIYRYIVDGQNEEIELEITSDGKNYESGKLYSNERPRAKELLSHPQG